MWEWTREGTKQGDKNINKEELLKYINNSPKHRDLNLKKWYTRNFAEHLVYY